MGGAAARSERRPAAADIFRRFLRERGLRATPVRIAILQAILDHSGHFDVDELFLDLRRRNERISKASIYRTIPLLVEAGLINQIYFEDGRLHYEPVYGRDHHCHLRCSECRRVIEFKNEMMLDLEARLAEEHGFLIQGHQVEVYGLCPECRKKRDQTDFPDSVPSI